MALNPIPEPPEGLLQRVNDGEEAAFEALYRLYSAPAFTVAVRMLGQREAAEDVLQEVFLDLTRTLRSYRGDGPFWGWLRRLVVNRVLMRLRSERSRPTLVGWESDEHGEWAEPRLFARDLEQALAELPPLTRAVVWLHDVEGWTHQEIADAVGRSPSFSKSQLSRAHLRLRALLANDDEPYRQRATGIA